MTALQPGVVIADRYRLEEPLGRGGMGEVYRAHHLGLDIPCAIKFIRSDRDNAKAVSRFKQEARAAAKLRSSHVVQMLDYGVWEELPYIAMELLEGETLRDRLDRQDRLSNGQTLALVRDVCRALTRAKELGIVHRDLKPENLFFVSEGDRELVKVLDFGIAKVPVTEVTAETKSGALIGTPFYMSPEQASAEKGLDVRSDLWSLAIIVFACLTGHLPFTSTVLGAVLKEILVEPLAQPRDLAPELPSALDAWWSQATDRDPERRFQTPEAFAKALDEALLRKPHAAETPVIGSPKSVEGLLAYSDTIATDKTTHAPLSSDLARPARTAEIAEPAPASGSSPRWAPALAAVIVLGIGGAWALRGGDSAEGDAPAAGESAEASSSASATSETSAPTATATTTATATASATSSATASASASAGPTAPVSRPAAPKPVAAPPKPPPPKPIAPKPKPPPPKPSPKPLDPGY